jgi:hypothetical protein
MVFSSSLVSSTNKTDRHDITEILLKVALNTMKKQAIITDFSNFTDFIISELDDIFIFFEIEKKKSMIIVVFI